MAKTFWQRQLGELGITVTLARWRWRQQQLLLLVAGLGILLATVLVCSLPLLSSVMVTAGLRTTLRSAPGSTRLDATVNMKSMTSVAINQAMKQVTTTLFQSDLGSNLDNSASLTPQVEIGGWNMTGSGYKVVLHGASLRDAAPHLQVLQGRLPDDAQTGTVLDVALTQSAATYMGVRLGSNFSLIGSTEVDFLDETSTPQIYSQTLVLHVVGIFQTVSSDPYWYNQTFQEPTPTQLGPVPFYVLVSTNALLHQVDVQAQLYQTSQTFLVDPGHLSLSYTLAVDHLRGGQLDDLLSRLGQLQADAERQPNKAQSGLAIFPFITGVSLAGMTLHGPSSPELLDVYQNEVLVGQATLLVLTIQLAGLLLFFISILADVLVEQQATAIALLRSRGASRLQILGTFLLQGLVLCLLAGLVAPWLALGVTRLCIPLFLQSTSQDALNVLPDTFQSLLSSAGPYVLAALLVTAGTLLFSFLSALRGDVRTLRREAARSTSRPLWQRLRLDLVLAAIALAGYGFIFYVQGTQQLLDVHTQQILLTPLNMFASLLLLLAGLLFFLRLFPLLLRGCARLATSRRGAASQLAVAQMERAPRQATRMALLLGLAMAFAIFTLIFSASQTQRALDLAAYQAGADFSGALPLNIQSDSKGLPANVIERYQSVAGVNAVSPGYVAQVFYKVNPGSPDQFVRPLQLRAVDSQTFALTADWSDEDSTQSLAALMTRLVSLRSQASQQKVVPAILSDSAWQLLHLHAGATFTILTDAGLPDPVHYLAVASIAHIPPANESIESGMLVDYQTLFAAAQKQQEPLQLNHIWLRTSDDPAALSSVRHALTTFPLGLTNLSDRRAIAQLNATNPLALNLLVVLSLGVSTTLLLGLLANLLLPILNLRARLTSFAFLRALGAAPALVARLLAWEQGLVLATAWLLGLLFGLPLALLSVPSLIVSSMPIINVQTANVNAGYLLQELIPAHVILPTSLLLACLALLLLCFLTLFVIVTMALRPNLGQQLRLNED